MTIWLDTARALVLHKPLPAAAVDLLAPPSVTAAAGDPPPDLDAAQAATEVWTQAVARHVDPALNDAFGEAFLDAARRADISPLPFQLAYLESVHDRLRIWPEGAFEELRPELLEMLSESMDYEQIEERIGRILDIDAPSRRLRAEISAVDREIADPNTSPSDRRALRARRRALWEQHDASLGQWQWLARRIARTEIHGAIEGGTLAAAQAVEQAGGQARFKRWLATTDERTRGTHVVADGQMVKLAEPFRVGLAELQHPGEAGGPAHEVINCRCTMLILTESEVQDALQGVWGGRGVAPGAARMGPDDPDDAAAALARWEAEQRGEVVEQPARTEPEPVSEPEPLPDSSPETHTEPGGPEAPEDEEFDDGLDDQDEPEPIDDDHDFVDEVDADTDREPEEPDEDDADTDADPISDHSRALIDRTRADLPDDWDALTDAEVDSHLDAVLSAGTAVWSDITAALDRDTTVRDARRRAAERGTVADRRDAARAESHMIRAALVSVRDLGGHQQRATTSVPTSVRRLPGGVRSGDAATLDDLREAETYFPADWLRAADERGELLLARGDRGRFVPDAVDGRDLIVGVGAAVSYAGGLARRGVAVLVDAIAQRMRLAVAGLARLMERFAVRMSVAALDVLAAGMLDVFGRAARWASIAALAAFVIAVLLLL